MAEPYDSAWLLEDVSAIIQQQYFPEFTEEAPGRFGAVVNKYFKPSMDAITGDGKTMQVEIAPGDTVRFGTDPLGPFASPDVFQAGSIKVRFNKATSTSSDFSHVSASCQTNDIDLEVAGRGSIIDFVERMFKQIMPEYDEKLAVHRHLSRSATVGTVADTPKQNNSFNMSQATSGSVTNATGARFTVSAGSISYFRPGTRIDIYNGANLVVGNVAVTDSNPADLSIGVQYVSGSNTVRNSTGPLALNNVASGNSIFYSNERNAGMYSLGSYFSAPTAGESFIGGVDRTTSGYRWMIPVTTRPGLTAATLTKSMVDDLAISMGYRQEDEYGVVVTTSPDLHQKLRNEYTEAAFLNIPDGDNRLKRFANFGTMGLNYQHPVFGLVKVMSDVLHVPNTVRVIVPETWRSLYYGFRGLKMMPGTKGGWYRVTETTPNTGLSKVWKCDWYALQTDWCSQPWKNGQILNVQAT
jgi:hypothetical protein